MNARDLLRLRGSYEAPRVHHAARRRGACVAACVHATLAYIVARRDRVLIFASPMSEPDINSVIERESVCH